MEENSKLVGEECEKEQHALATDLIINMVSSAKCISMLYYKGSSEIRYVRFTMNTVHPLTLGYFLIPTNCRKIQYWNKHDLHLYNNKINL